MESIESLPKECIRLLHKNRLLLPLIRAELIKDLLSNINIDSQSITELLETSKRNLGIDSDDKYNSWLLTNNLSKKEFEDLALSKTKMDLYCNENFKKKVHNRFLERKNELDIVVYSLIRTSDLFQARELFIRILEGEAEFGEVAAKYSEGIEKKTRGIIGPVPIAKAHPILREHLRKSPVGQVRAPIQIDDSYLVVRVESLDPAKLDEFMKEKLYQELFNNLIETKAVSANKQILNQLKIAQKLVEIK
tara:strand:+ start:75 stop:821 length:747 start_codon:yes stop_codon:yes gene_type:complete